MVAWTRRRGSCSLRSQGITGHEDEDTFSPVVVGEDLDLKTPADLFAAPLYTLGSAVLVAGLGLGLRLAAEGRWELRLDGVDDLLAG